MAKGYEARSELCPCSCGSRNFWFDDEADEWWCWTCEPPIVENVIRLELTGEIRGCLSTRSAGP
jgi:hypothetical protein